MQFYPVFQLRASQGNLPVQNVIPDCLGWAHKRVTGATATGCLAAVAFPRLYRQYLVPIDFMLYFAAAQAPSRATLEPNISG